MTCRLDGNSGGKAGRIGLVGRKRKCTGREEDFMGSRKKGLGVTMREEGSDVDVGVNEQSVCFS